MGDTDFFGKLDDILFAPVKLITDYLSEPLNIMHNKRDRERAEHAAEIELKRRKHEAQLEREKAESLAEIEMQKQAQLAKQNADEVRLAAQIEKEKAEYTATLQLQQIHEQASIDAEKKEHEARLQMEMRRFNAEMDVIIAQQEEERRDRLVESIKRYQIDLANAMKDIVESIGMMSLELYRKAYALVEEQTKAYKLIQDEAKKQSILEIEEAKDVFMKDDPETYRILVNSIIEERHTMFETADKFIVGLSEDLKRINQATTEIIQTGMDNINKNTTSMASSLPSSVMSHACLPDNNCLGDKDVIDIVDISKD